MKLIKEDIRELDSVVGNYKIMNSIIVNKEDNRKLAEQIKPLLVGYKNRIPMKRDNCGPINWDLYDYLVSKGLDKDKLLMKRGTFKTDNLSLIDKNDLTKEDRILYKECGFDVFSNEQIIDFIKGGNASESISDFYFLPHQWLEYEGLILDAASDMFNKAMESKISKRNYIPYTQE